MQCRKRVKQKYNNKQKGGKITQMNKVALDCM